MKGLALTFCIVFLVFQNSCKSQNQSLSKEEKDSTIILVDNDPYSGVFESQTTVIRDAKSLAKFYSIINRTRKPGLPVPNIDFSKDLALLICTGEQKPNTTLTLSYGEEDSDSLVINCKNRENTTKDGATITVITYPFYLYTIPKTEKSIVFKHIP